MKWLREVLAKDSVGFKERVRQKRDDLRAMTVDAVRHAVLAEPGVKAIRATDSFSSDIDLPVGIEEFFQEFEEIRYEVSHLVLGRELVAAYTFGETSEPPIQFLKIGHGLGTVFLVRPDADDVYVEEDDVDSATILGNRYPSVWHMLFQWCCDRDLSATCFMAEAEAEEQRAKDGA